MTLTFAQPFWLIAAILTLPLAFLALRWFTAMSAARRWSAIAARTVLILLLIAALAGASAVNTSDRLGVVVVADVSGSMTDFAAEFADLGTDPASGTRRNLPEALRAWIETIAEERGPDDLLGLVVFDGGAISVATPAATDYTRYEFNHKVREGTDIAGALRYAATLFPPGARRRIILISDGNNAGPDPIPIARELAAAGTRIDTIPIAYRADREIILEAVDVPPQAQESSTVAVRVVIASTSRTTGTLGLLYDDAPIDINGPATPGLARPISLNPGRNVFLIELPLAQRRIVHRITPIFTPDDPTSDRIADNNSAETFTVTPGAGRVLIADGTADSRAARTNPLADALASAGIDVQAVTPASMPLDLLAMQAYDLIILQSVPVEDIPSTTQQALADYVQSLGGGLVMVGGPGSFAPGGWIGSPLEPILPVELEVPDKLISPAAAVALVLDSSGSMARPVLGGSRSQQQIANESAAHAVETLEPNDLLVVVDFDSDARIAWPLQKNTDPKAAAAAIRNLTSGGGTSIAPALFEAYKHIKDADAPIKHVILLSDGQDEHSATDAPELALRMAADDITVSTIGVGDDADAIMLDAIARAGDGTFYRVIDPNTLVRIFLKEIRIIRQPLIRLGRFTPIRLPTGSPITTGIITLPDLRGFVLTQPRDDPRAINALATEDGKPLLAHWAIGRGQAAAFTSDAHDWAREWLNTDSYTRFWTQLARTIARPSGQRGADLTTQIVGDQLIVRLDATSDSGQPLAPLTVEGILSTPDNERHDIRLEQVGPTAYEARFPATQRGSYVIALSPREGNRQLPVVVGGATRATSSEYQHLTSNVALMRDIAEAADGRILDLTTPDTAAVFDRTGMEPTRAASPIWRTLIIWALIVFLLDAATRRIAWDRLLVREIAEEMRAHAAHTIQARTRAALATVGALRSSIPAESSTSTPAPQPATTDKRTKRDQRRAAAATDRDAQSAAEAERALAEERAREERRLALRKQALSRLSGLPTSKDAPSPPAPPRAPKAPNTDQPTPEKSTTADLREAKRRAQQRFTQDDDQS